METMPPFGFSHGSFSTFHINASASDMRCLEALLAGT